MKLFFARHGESEANVLRVFSNRGGAHPLTETGRRQAEALAETLAGVSFARVYASPLLRARQTAELVARRLSAGPVIEAEALREYDVGVLEGRSDEAAWAEYFRVAERWRDPRNRDERVEGGESYAGIRERFRRFVRSLIDDAALKDGSDGRCANVLLVTHGGLLRVGLPAILDGLSYGRMLETPIGNCGAVVAETRGEALASSSMWCILSGG